MDEFDLFTQAIKIDDPTKRSAMLEATCAEHPDVRERVESLLRNYLETGSFLERPVGAIGNFISPGPSDGGNDNTIVIPAEVTPNVLGNYEIIEQVGHGGMGTVYKARHTRLDRTVAIKLLHPADSACSETLARFDREMLAVGKLDHPHLVRALDAGEIDSRHFLVMELIEGINLAQLVKQQGPLTTTNACELVRQAALGLQAVYEYGMVHRDIKPSNLMLTPSGRVKILDLGLARLTDAQSTVGRELTAAGQIMGTLDYLAPEQCESSHDVDIRADLYSLGATLYYLLSGRTLFSDRNMTTPVQHLKAILVETPTSIRDHRPGLPAELASIVDRLLSKDPDNRPDTPQDVVALLEPFCRDYDPPSLAVSLTDTSADTGSLSAIPTVDYTPSQKPSLRTTSKVQARPNSRKFARTRLVGLGILAIVLAAAGYTFFIKVGNVDVKVTIDDPDISVRFGDQIVTFEGSVEPIKLRPGNHGFVVERGDLTLKTDEFTVKRAGKNVLHVTAVDGQVVVVKNGERPSPKSIRAASGKPSAKPPSAINPAAVAQEPTPFPADASVDRKAATWVFEVGGFVSVRLENEQESREIKTVESLPSEPFALVHVYLRYDKTIKELKLDGVTSLEHLDLLGTNIPPDRQQLSQFKRLNYLRVSLADVNAWGETVKDFRTLRTLSFYRSGAFDSVTEDISGMTWLTEVNFESCNITNAACKHIAKLKNLERLNLSTAPINAEGLKQLATLPKLMVLVLKSSEIDDEAMSHIGQMRKLEHLILVGGKISAEGARHLANLTDLHSIFLRYTNIDDDGLMHLAELPKLRSVDVNVTDVTPTGVAAFKKKRPNVDLIGQ